MPGRRLRQRFRQLDQFNRGRLVGMMEAGLSMHQVAHRLSVSVTTVRRWWIRYRDGGSHERQRGSGRSRIKTSRDDRYLRMQILRDRFASTRVHGLYWWLGTGQRTSLRTVYRRAIQLGLRSRRPVIRIPLGPVHRQARLNWCRDRQNWGIQEWEEIVFSDESRFCLDFSDGRRRVRRLPTERFLEACIAEHDCYGGGSVMVWGAISLNGRSQLVVIHGNLTGQRYVDEILQPVLVPFLRNDPASTFQQDNARSHTCRVTTNFLRVANVPILPWPARSPDLSPIEHLWDNLGRRVRDNRLDPPATLGELEQRLVAHWQQIPQQEVHHLYESMPRRLQACIAARGGHTRY